MNTERLARLAALRQEAQQQYDKSKGRLRRHYQLAKELGFTAEEAKLLKGRSEEYIRDLARALPLGGGQ